MIQALVLKHTQGPLETVDVRQLAPYEAIVGELHPDVRDYLLYCLPSKGYEASGLRIKSLQLLEQENLQHAVPGALLAPFGLLVVATSIGGNAVCFDNCNGEVHWAETSRFSEDGVSFADPTTGEWVEQPLGPGSVRRALVSLSPAIEEFLVALLNDILTKELDALD